MMTAKNAGRDAERIDASGSPRTDAPRTTAEKEVPTGWQMVFASLFTPTWSLSLLLFMCLFLPSYEGCSGQVVHVRDVLTESPTADSIYPAFLVTWPYFFALIVAVGTLWMAWSRRPERACGLWWWLSAIVVLHGVLLATILALDVPRFPDVQKWDLSEWLHISYWFGTSMILLALIPITFRYCRTWFHAATWLQLALAVTASICLSFYIPAVLFARKLLVGGRLATAFSVFLIVATIVQRLDGHRALVRRRGEPPLRLSLKSMLLLMSVGGLACAWAGVYLVFGIEFWDKQ